MSASTPSTLRLVLAFAVMVTVWSFSLVVVKIVTQEAPAMFVALLRAVGTAIAIAPLALWHARRNPPIRFRRADLPRFIAVALTGITINQVCFILGVSRTSVAHSSIVLSMMPMLVLLASVIAGQERASGRQFVGMAVAMAGVGWLQVSPSEGSVASPVGDLLSFLSTAAFGVYTVLNKQLTARYGGSFLIAASFAIGSLAMVPLGLWAGRGVDMTQWSARVWLSIAYMVLFQGVVGYTCFYYLLTHVPATHVSMYCYIQPLEATLFAWMVLAEPITPAVVIAGLLVSSGVWLTVRASSVRTT